MVGETDGITVVLVNPYATKQAKELDDNSQTKSEKRRPDDCKAGERWKIF